MRNNKTEIWPLTKNDGSLKKKKKRYILSIESNNYQHSIIYPEKVVLKLGQNKVFR